jgi:hypothetical protein
LDSILQCSQGGAAYFAGKGVDNKNQEASIAGAVAAAHYIRSVAPGKTRYKVFAIFEVTVFEMPLTQGPFQVALHSKMADATHPVKNIR